MPREIEERKIRKALRRIQRAKALADSEDDRRQLSEWEAEFVASLEARLNEYGSAFADPEKGDLSEPLSALQKRKIREIEDKAKGKTRKGLGRGTGLRNRKPLRRSKTAAGSGPRVRDIAEDAPQPDNAPDAPPDRPSGAPSLKVIKGGRD